MSKVVVLGINGHIGNAAARAFLAAGYEVIPTAVTFDRYGPSHAFL